MRGWNYRIMRRETGEEDEPYAFGIHEVYYGYRDKVEGWTVSPMEPHGATMKDLRADLAMMKKAFTAPVLDHKTGKATPAVRNAREGRGK
jgi:hypothetical protein